MGFDLTPHPRTPYEYTPEEELRQWNHHGTVSRKTTGGEENNLILMQLQITNISSIRTGIHYLICETSESNT